ncbi:hypothetical protein JCM5353_002625, partial [Sporobolomyces roseus]
PYLPPELVDHILQDSSLSKSDLARCCLVNRDFVQSARPLLYAELAVTTICLLVGEECWLDNATLLLFRTVSGNPSLGIGYATSTGVSHVDTYMWSSDRVRESILARGLQWKEFVTGGAFLEEDTHGNRRTWSKLRNLKELRCEVVKRNNGDTSPIPDHLEVLDITYAYPQDFPLSLSPGSQLRVLRMIPSNSNLQHLGSMGQLRHLYLFINYYTSVLSSETLSSLSRLPLLESLSVEYYRPTQNCDNIIRSLLIHLPPSLRRLDFPRYIPFDSLTRFLKNDDNSQFQILGIGQTREQNWNVMGDNEFEECANRLSEICKEKGILIERITLQEDIFRPLPLLRSSQHLEDRLLTMLSIAHSCLDEASYVLRRFSKPPSSSLYSTSTLSQYYKSFHEPSSPHPHAKPLSASPLYRLNATPS